MHKIACIGDNCIDYYFQSNSLHFGGNPVNVAVYTKRLGFDACYIGAIGNDANGDAFVQALQEKEIDISHLHRENGKTALTFVEIQNGDRVFGEYIEGVMEDFQLTQEDREYICRHKLVVSGLWGKCEKEYAYFQAKGIITAFDCSDRPDDPVALEAIPYCDIVFFSNDHDNEELIKQQLKAIYQKGAKVVAATRGAKGSLAYDGVAFYFHGVMKIQVVDTMGAGDSFIAGFINAYVDGCSISDCMHAGTQCSAVTLGYSGAW